jgi:hypothetical protein
MTIWVHIDVAFHVGSQSREREVKELMTVWVHIDVAFHVGNQSRERGEGTYDNLGPH